MPHIIVEYSKGVSEVFDVDKLIEDLHDCAMNIEALPVGGLRVRANESAFMRVGDGKFDRNFIYIIIRLGQGRSDDVKRDIGERLFATLTDFTQDAFSSGKALSLGLEIQEIEKDWTWKKNNIHQIIKDETHGET